MRPIDEETEKVALTGITDAREFLECVMAGLLHPTKIQFEAAKCLLPYQHGKTSSVGKKEAKRLQAHQLVSKFAPSRRITTGDVEIDGKVENFLS